MKSFRMYTYSRLEAEALVRSRNWLREGLNLSRHEARSLMRELRCRWPITSGTGFVNPLNMPGVVKLMVGSRRIEWAERPNFWGYLGAVVDDPSPPKPVQTETVKIHELTIDSKDEDQTAVFLVGYSYLANDLIILKG